MAVSNARAAASTSWMLSCNGSAMPPAASISLAAVKIVPGSVGCGSAVFAARTTFAPSSARRLAIAKPMPREPPVTKATLFASILATRWHQVNVLGRSVLLVKERV